MKHTLASILTIILVGSVLLLGWYLRPKFEWLSNDIRSALSPFTEGQATIEGQVFSKTLGGMVFKGAGEKVYLLPITRLEYKDESQAANDLEIDQILKKFTATTITDADGRYKLEGIPRGKYNLISSVNWKYPATGEEMGGVVQTTVTIEKNSKNTIMIN